MSWRYSPPYIISRIPRGLRAPLEFVEIFSQGSIPGMDIRKIKKLIELLEESGIAEIEIKEGEEAVRISRMPAGAAAVQPLPAQAWFAPGQPGWDAGRGPAPMPLAAAPEPSGQAA